jgi:histidine ammonia-lyase
MAVDAAVWGRVRRAHETAQAASAARPVYGRTTGVGANRDALVGADDAGGHDLRLLLSHAAGVGDRLDARTTRAAMLIRLNQLAAGGSGIDPQFPQALEHALQTDALPVVHIPGRSGATSRRGRDRAHPDRPAAVGARSRAAGGGRSR